MHYQLEICANSLASALNAAAGGAQRIELCDNLWEGGTTPSAASIQLACQKLPIPVFVLIRPRGGDFCYSKLELELMLADIELAKQLGAKGIVSGILDKHGSVDQKRTRQLIEAAAPLPFTFHRAFDFCIDLSVALEQLIEIGAQRILSSGGANSVPEGLSTITALQKQAAGRIQLMPGGGISPQNIASIAQQTGCMEFHASAKSMQPTKMQYWPQDLRLNGSKEMPEKTYFESNTDLVLALKKELDALNNC